MKIKALASFGYAAFAVQFNAGESKEITVDSAGLYATGIYFFVSGLCEVTVRDTGQRLADRTPGWLSVERTSDGAPAGDQVLTCYFPQDTIWICLPKVANPGGLPDISSVVMPPGSTRVLLNNSNMLLCAGTLKKDTTELTGPCQIRVRSGDTAVTAETDVYALKFN